MRFLFKVIFNTLIGGVVLVVINFIGGFVKFHIALNVITAGVVGNFGIPGVVLLTVLKIIFKVK